MTSEIGIIKTAKFGLGGGDNALFGLFLEFETETWEAQYNATTQAPGRNTFLTEQEMFTELTDICRFLSKNLRDAGIKYVHELEGKSVNIHYTERTIQSWEYVKKIM
jgi:hypothetical protein